MSNVSILIVTTGRYFKLVLRYIFRCSWPFCIYLTIHLCVNYRWMYIQNLQDIYKTNCMFTYAQYFTNLLRLSNVMHLPDSEKFIHDFQNACAAEFSSTPIVLSYINLDKITYLAGILSHFSKKRLIYFRYWFAEYVRLKAPILKSCWHSSSCTHKVRLIFFIKKMRG